MTALEQVIVDIEESEDILDSNDRATALEWLRNPTWKHPNIVGWSRVDNWTDRTELTKDKEITNFSNYVRLTSLFSYDSSTVDPNIFRNVSGSIYGSPTTISKRTKEWLTRTRYQSTYKETYEWQTYVNEETKQT